MRFDSVLVMGANQIACDCVALLATKVSTTMLSVLETVRPTLSMLPRLAHKHGLEYVNITDTGRITEYLMGYTRNRRVLIISANNRYIFREDLISQPNVEIINFHYALLPAYRGMNIPTWVIYNGEAETGITWHYVTSEIDHGSIIAQRTIWIEDTTTAFDITRKGMQLGKDAFASFYEELLEREIEGREAFYPQDGRVYRARELPDNGCLDLDKPVLHISRLLRAYDYRGMGLMPKLKLDLKGMRYSVERYSIVQKEEAGNGRMEKSEEGSIILSGNGMRITIGLVPMEIDENGQGD